MRAVIIEDETTAVNSLKALLARNTVTPVEVVAELESIEAQIAWYDEEIALSADRVIALEDGRIASDTRAR